MQSGMLRVSRRQYAKIVFSCPKGLVFTGVNGNRVERYVVEAKCRKELDVSLNVQATLGEVRSVDDPSRRAAGRHDRN